MTALWHSVERAKTGDKEACWRLQEAIADAYHGRIAGYLHHDPETGQSVAVRNDEHLNLHPALQEWLAWLVVEVMEGRMTAKAAGFMDTPPKGMGVMMFDGSGNYRPPQHERETQIAARVRWWMRRDELKLTQAVNRVVNEVRNPTLGFDRVKRIAEDGLHHAAARAWLDLFEDCSPPWCRYTFPGVTARN